MPRLLICPECGGKYQYYGRCLTCEKDEKSKGKRGPKVHYKRNRKGE
jgi:hypothetical protein